MWLHFVKKNLSNKYFIPLGQHATQTCATGRFGAEMGSDNFGACIMGHNPDMDSQKVIIHLEHVELSYVGQEFRYIQN